MRRETAHPMRIVLLTDGKPDPSSDADIARAEAEAAKKAGIEIITIGVGDVDTAFLQEIASAKAFVATGFDQAVLQELADNAARAMCGAGNNTRRRTSRLLFGQSVFLLSYYCQCAGECEGRTQPKRGSAPKISNGIGVWPWPYERDWPAFQLLVACLVLSCPLPQCFRLTVKHNDTVTPATEVNPGELPFVGRLSLSFPELSGPPQIPALTGGLCSASLIHPLVILTAGLRCSDGSRELACDAEGPRAYASRFAVHLGCRALRVQQIHLSDQAMHVAGTF